MAQDDDSVQFSPEALRSIASIDRLNPDFTIKAIALNCWGDKDTPGGFEVKWETESAGFGSTTVYVRDGVIRCDNECMGRKFITAVFAKLIETMVLDD